MISLRSGVRWSFCRLEILLDRIFGPHWNPLYQLGALGFFYYWVVAVSGIYVYILFDTGTTEAYQSVEYMTVEQWYLGGIMRSLHRYASDGMVLMMVLHILREWGLGRFRGPHWYVWVTGTPILWLVFIAGISGYWLVWDELGQYVAITTAEWFDWLGIFGEPIARNFLTPASLDDRLFTLLVFIHVVVPLLLLLVLWLHLLRVSRPRINPNRGLALGTILMLIALSLVKPAVSHAPANLAEVPDVLRLDWYYLVAYPLVDQVSPGAAWAFVGALSLILIALPWLPPRRIAAPAIVHLANCNGCARCADDCPYNAILMKPRTDGQPFEHEARVDSKLCLACGICAGACPTATPFRRRSPLEPGIELADQTVAALREAVETAGRRLAGDKRIIVFACDHGGGRRLVDDDQRAVIHVPCVGAVPPPFLDYVLSRDHADGVVLSGCREGNCYYRKGIAWTEARVARARDPYLRRRVPRERIAMIWTNTTERARLEAEIAAFCNSFIAPDGSSPAATANRAECGPAGKVDEHA